MLFKPLALAAAAAAFVIVPAASEQDEGIFKALPVQPETFKLPPEVLSQSVELPCKKCRGEDTRLKLDFAVEDGSRLVLNGFELYPEADPWHGDLIAPVVRGDGTEKTRRLGYSLAVIPRAVDEEQQIELLDVVLNVIEIGHHYVSGIPNVKVGLVKAGTGEILIANMELQEVNEEEPKEEECMTVFCRVKSALHHALKNVKGHLNGCGRHGAKGHHRPHGPGSEPDGENHHEMSAAGEDHEHDGKRPERHGDGEHRGKHHGMHHGKHPHHHYEHSWKSHHSWLHLLKKVASHIILPVLMGITAGLGVAFFAMFLCSLIYVVRFSFLIRDKRRFGLSRRCDKKKDSAQYVSAEDEKAALMEVDEEVQETNEVPYRD